MKLWLLRHAQTTSNTGISTGKEAELTPTGIEQAKRAGMYFKKMKIDKIYCSKMIRAKQTLKEIKPYLKEVPISYRKDLNERSRGIYAYKPKEYKQAFGKFKKSEKAKPFEAFFKPPKGENIPDLEVRADKVFNFLKNMHKQGNILIISHGFFMRFLVLRIFNLPMKESQYFELHNGGISYFKFDSKFNVKDFEIDDYKHLIKFSSYQRKPK